MKIAHCVLAALLAVPVLGPAEERTADPRVQRAVAEAREISRELTEHLRELLSRELTRGGFAGAVRVCSETALRSTRKFSERKGRSVRRISLKHRNPANAPDSDEREMLEKLASLKREGKLQAEYHSVVEGSGGPVLQYYKPITVGAMCLNCHGPAEQIPEQVRAILSQRYPQDRATGYAAGDLRGAIAVKVPLSHVGR